MFHQAVQKSKLRTLKICTENRSQCYSVSVEIECAPLTTIFFNSLLDQNKWQTKGKRSEVVIVPTKIIDLRRKKKKKRKER